MSTESQEQDLVKMILSLQEKSSVSRNTISINPMTAFMSSGLIILVLIQFMIGFGMWSIQDRLKRYDDYEARISVIEKSMVRFEAIPESIHSLVEEIRLLSGNIDTNKDDINKRLQILETELLIMQRSVKGK